MSKSNLDELRNNPLFQLSLSAKELFHSNFLLWLADSHTAIFNELLKDCFGLNFSFDSKKHIACREFLNFDFCICEKKGAGTSQVKCGKILFVLENKFKSLPSITQLEKYELKSKDHNDKIDKFESNRVRYVLLTISEVIENEKDLNNWSIVNYYEYVTSLKNAISKMEDGFEKDLIAHYCDFVKTIIAYFRLNIPTGNDLLQIQWNKITSEKETKDLRIDDIYQKIYVSRIGAHLRNKLKIGKEWCDVEQFLSSKDENYPVGSIILGVGFSRGSALLEVKIKLRGNLLFGVQVQDGQYRHLLETTTEYVKNNPKEFFEEWLNQNNKKLKFFRYNDTQWDTKSVPKGKVYPEKNHVQQQSKMKGFNGYKNTFIYQSVKISNDSTVDEICNAIIDDIKHISVFSLKHDLTK